MMSNESKSGRSRRRSAWFWRGMAGALFVATVVVALRCGGSVAAQGDTGGTSGTAESGTGSGDSKPSVCVAGSARSCLCADGLNGMQLCLSDGSGYSVCSECGVSMGGAGGVGGGGGTGGASGAPVADAGCGLSGHCFGSSFPGCEECTCANCVCESDRCGLSDGCNGIARCVEFTKCSGADCYQPDTCQRAIDEAGAEGRSLWEALQSCRSAAGCVCDPESAGISCTCDTIQRCSDGSERSCYPYACNAARGTCFAFCETDDECCCPGYCRVGGYCNYPK
jgi:hypothetical protein